MRVNKSSDSKLDAFLVLVVFPVIGLGNSNGLIGLGALTMIIGLGSAFGLV